eukprot:478600-Pelagomonas_calceolata.AAC.4
MTKPEREQLSCSKKVPVTKTPNQPVTSAPEHAACGRPAVQSPATARGSTSACSEYNGYRGGGVQPGCLAGPVVAGLSQPETIP